MILNDPPPLKPSTKPIPERPETLALDWYDKKPKSFQKVQNNIIKDIIKDILKTSYENKLGHIPSALSWVKMLYEIFSFYNIKDNIFIFGKFWGAQGLYAVLRELKIADVKHMSELPFVYNINYETIGDTLGFACGIAMATKKPVICVMPDACMQSGYIYEAIEFILQHDLNIKIFVDDNGQGVCDYTDNVLSLKPLKTMLKGYNKCFCLNPNSNNKKILSFTANESCFYFYKNTKGDMIPLMQDKSWHYKLLDEETYNKLMLTF